MNASTRALLCWILLFGLAGCHATLREPTPSGATSTVAAPIAIPNSTIPLDGVLTGGQPTAEDLETAARVGYGTVINLRGIDEEGLEGEREIVEALGMRYVHIPVSGAADLTRANAQWLADELARPGTLPVMIHCASGNRVGALLALEAAWIRGIAANEAIGLGRSAGLTSLGEATRKILGLTAD